jgi:uncharacterized protein (DUF1697 family)
VNVGGRKLPMAELRALCGEIGWANASTYIASGNLLFTADGERGALESRLEQAIAARFAMDVPVIVRTVDEWALYAPSNPFPDAARETPNLLMLLVPKREPAAGAVESLTAKAAPGERIARAGDALWIHFAGGSARSKLTPSLIDRAIGSPATSRNYRTVLKLDEMLR